MSPVGRQVFNRDAFRDAPGPSDREKRMDHHVRKLQLGIAATEAAFSPFFSFFPSFILIPDVQVARRSK